MENIKKAVDATQEKNAIEFREVIASELAKRLYSALNTKKESISKSLSSDSLEPEEAVAEAIVGAPSAPATGGRVGIAGSDRANAGAGEVPDPLEVELKAEIESAFGLKNETDKAIAKDSDVSLDPNFEKEFYVKEMDYNGHKVVLKQVGLGLSKPVRVYVDNKRWEFFAGPELALKASKSYIDGFEADTNKEESVSTDDDTLTEKVELDARTRVYRNTVTRLEQARKNKESRGNRLDEKLENHNDKNFNHLYNDGTGKGAIIPKPFNFSKPSDTAKLVAGQINTTVDEATNMSNQEILDAVNMKGGKYMMDEEELSPKQKAYRKFFNGALKKHGASSPSELEGDKKKKFFDYVKANWKG